MRKPEAKLALLDIAAIARRWCGSADDVLQHAAFNGLQLGVFYCDGLRENKKDGAVIPHATLSVFCRISHMQVRRIMAKGSIEVSTTEMILNGLDRGSLERHAVCLGAGWVLVGDTWDMVTIPETDRFVISQDKLTAQIADVEAFEKAGPNGIEKEYYSLGDDAGKENARKSVTLDWAALRSNLDAFFDKAFEDLPEPLREDVSLAYHSRPDFWDTHSFAQRREQIEEFDVKNNPERLVEHKAGWWLLSMDADFWWTKNESISPIHAAMLLARRNPNTETPEDAETCSSDEMEPEDFRRLKNTFDGASNKQKTLKEWTAYARERDLKIHSWICDWEAWVREVDAKATEQSPTQSKAPRVSPAAALPVLQVPTAGTTKHKIKSRTQFLDAEISEARKSAIDNADPKSVWVALLKLAEKQFGCLLGPDGKDIRYQSGEEVKYFKLRNLRERMTRAATQ